MNALIAGFLGTVVLANVLVSVWVSRTDWLLRNQKLAQIILIWLVPVLGATGIAIFLHSNSNRERPHVRSEHIPDENDWVPGSGRSHTDD